MFGKTKYGTVAFIFIFQLGVSPRIQGSDFTYLTYITRRSAATSFDYIFFTIDDALTGLLLSIFIWAWFVEMPSWKSAGWCALVTFIHCLATVIYIFLPTWIGGKVFRGFVMQYYYVAFVILQIRRRKLIQRHPKSIQWLAIIDMWVKCSSSHIKTNLEIHLVHGHVLRS